MDQVENLFVPDPPAGDSSNRIADTRFVQNAISASAGSTLSNAGALSVIGNASTVAGPAASIADTGANQLLVSNAANTTILWSSITNYIDNAIASAQGDILYRNAASWVALAPGTAGFVLKTQGAAANPLWAGGLTLLNTLSPNNVATAGDTTSFTSTFRNYLITFNNVCPAIQSTMLLMQVATSGTSFITSTTYATNVNGISSVNISAIFLTGNASLATSLNYGVNGWAMLCNPSAAVGFKNVIANVSSLSSSNNTSLNVNTNAGAYTGTTAPVTGIQFVMGTGNIQTGTIEIWGMA